MSERLYIVGNWKMTGLGASLAEITAVKDGIGDVKCDVASNSTFVYAYGFAEDIDTKGEPEVTLSYTFFPSVEPAQAAQQGRQRAEVAREDLGHLLAHARDAQRENEAPERRVA